MASGAPPPPPSAGPAGPGPGSMLVAHRDRIEADLFGTETLHHPDPGNTFFHHR